MPQRVCGVITLGRQRKNWTQEEESYLMDNWGTMTIKNLARSLCRTEDAIIVRAKRLKLGSPYMEYLNANQASQILGVDSHTVTDYWIQKCGLKAKRQAMRNMPMWRICIDDLTEWLEQNQDKWDSRKVELYALGQEPEWMKEKRRADMKLPIQRFQKWTKKEEQLLMEYYRIGKSKKEIGHILGRTESGIQRKISRLKESGKLERSKIICHWGDEEIGMLLELERQGLSDAEIAWELGREAEHIVDKRRCLRKEGKYDGYKRDRLA